MVITRWKRGFFFGGGGLSISFAWGSLVCIVLHRRPDGAVHLLYIFFFFFRWWKEKVAFRPAVLGGG